MIPQDSVKVLSKPPGWGIRHLVIFLGFWGFAMSYAMRFNLSLAIVAMVKRSSSSNSSIIPSPSTNFSYLDFDHSQNYSHLMNPPLGPACPIPPPPNSSASSFFSLTPTPPPTADEGEFEWDEVQQGIILGSFFWGYVCTQLPGGIIAQRYGGKWPLGLGLLITAVFALLTPLAARTHVSLLIAARVIQGFGEGLTTPAMHMLLSKWVPPEERGTLASITYSGSSFGTAATMIVSGYLIQGNVLGGWPSVFYAFGAFTCVWFVLWTIFVFDSPEDHPRVGSDELYYIQRSIGDQISKVKPPTPWKAMATSLPLWVIIVAHTGHAWGLYTLLTELPTYMKTILNFDIKQNSWMSALPYALMCLTGFIIPAIADSFIKRKWMATVNVRKCCQVIAHIGGAMALIGASYSGCNTTLTVILLTIAGGVNGAAFGGFGVNHIDIASNHAGILMGITNTIANISGFLGPYVAGVLINGNATLGRWQIVFYIAAGIYVLDTLIFLFFATSDEQPWNRASFAPHPDLMHASGSKANLLEDDDDHNPDSYVVLGREAAEQRRNRSHSRHYYEDGEHLGFGASSDIISV